MTASTRLDPFQHPQGSWHATLAKYVPGAPLSRGSPWRLRGSPAPLHWIERLHRGGRQRLCRGAVSVKQPKASICRTASHKPCRGWRPAAVGRCGTVGSRAAWPLAHPAQIMAKSADALARKRQQVEAATVVPFAMVSFSNLGNTNVFAASSNDLSALPP